MRLCDPLLRPGLTAGNLTEIKTLRAEGRAVSESNLYTPGLQGKAVTALQILKEGFTAHAGTIRVRLRVLLHTEVLPIRRNSIQEILVVVAAALAFDDLEFQGPVDLSIKDLTEVLVLCGVRPAAGRIQVASNIDRRVMKPGESGAENDFLLVTQLSVRAYAFYAISPGFRQLLILRGTGIQMESDHFTVIPVHGGCGSRLIAVLPPVKVSHIAQTYGHSCPDAFYFFRSFGYDKVCAVADGISHGRLYVIPIRTGHQPLRHQNNPARKALLSRSEPKSRPGSLKKAAQEVLHTS